MNIFEVGLGSKHLEINESRRISQLFSSPKVSQQNEEMWEERERASTSTSRKRSRLEASGETRKVQDGVNLKLRN